MHPAQGRDDCSEFRRATQPFLKVKVVEKTRRLHAYHGGAVKKNPQKPLGVITPTGQPPPLPLGRGWDEMGPALLSPSS